ncbi:hypothetical protein BGZ97_010264 [Linnemannia gamsii]|jgi:hypothetical protein|uniref:NAD(P)-binding domain-containing protein n=1 Tax=Linnemannia gamsii TaxID=64522 RepID=A0A9P6QPI2_9FUNG|nr:hypothetical protein BGZ97_010264 [Linnemannia gamsii]
MTTSTSTSAHFIAFFGATGGCTNACLVHTLNAGFYATALARTPSKLTDMLLAQGLSQSVIDTQLTIVKGDIADIHAIKNVLTNNSVTTGSAKLASQIISGIGGTPQMRMSLSKPMTIDNPEICATATKNIVQSLQEIYASHPSTAQNRPSITVISTTGVSDVREDVPFGFRTFYHVVLADPHKDKKVMENLVIENASSTGVFRGAVVIRPSLLKGDQNVKSGKGWQKVKVGVEDKPAVGYTIHRADVGQWICEQIVKTGGESRFGQKVTLTC